MTAVAVRPVLPEGLGGRLVISTAEYRRSRMPWLRARQQGLGASDTATVLQLPGAWGSPLKTWLSKTQPITEDVFPTEAAEFGTEFEDGVARVFGRRHVPKHLRLAQTPGILAHPEHPWMLATLDRLIVERGRGGQVVSALEVKNVTYHAYREKWIDDVPPIAILVQVQQQIAVTGLPGIWVAACSNLSMRDPYWVARDDAVIEQLINYGGMWWNDHVVNGERPAPTLADAEDLSDLWPGDEDLPYVVADDKLARTLGMFLDARRREKEAGEEKKRLAFEIQTQMANSQAIRDMAGNVLATWKPAITKRLDTTALKGAEPELAARYTTETTGRRFLPKEPRT